MRTMILGIDLDEVTVQYVNGLRRSVAEQDGVEMDEAFMASHPEPDTYDFDSWPGFPADFSKYHREAVTRGLYRSLEAMPGASETLWKLSDEGHHIRIITSRFVGNKIHGSVVAQTAESLDNLNIPYRSLVVVDGGGKEGIYADLFLDDSPKNIAALKAAGLRAVIFDRLYNHHIEGERAKSWEDFYNIVQETVAANGARA